MRNKTHLGLIYKWLDVSTAKKVECCLCKNDSKQKLVSQFSLNGRLFEIRKCFRDNLMYLYPQPGGKYCEQLYNHPSYSTGEDDMYGLAMDDKRASEIAKIRIKEIISNKIGNKGDFFLEIGCGYGHLLNEARAAGFVASGVEFSKDGASLCIKKGLNVVRDDADSYVKNYKGGKYDIIVAYSVLEHLKNPNIFLKNIRRLIKSGGTLILRVPETKNFGPTLSLLDHFWHFTRKSLKNILIANNFKIVELFHSGTFKGIQHKGFLKSVTVIATIKSR